jgi:hypothetical protein
MICKLFKCLIKIDENKKNIEENINPIKKDIKDYKDNRVWVTKKVRIISEERMNRNNFHSIILINLYTFFILCYSILGLQYPSNNEEIGVVSVIVAVGLFGVSLFVTLYGFREKALAYKMSHLDLAKIETKMNSLILSEDKSDEELINQYEKYQIEYTDILAKTDNHLPMDFLKYEIDRGQATCSRRIKYYIKYFCPYWCLIIALYVVPLIGMGIILKDIWGGE